MFPDGSTEHNEVAVVVVVVVAVPGVVFVIVVVVVVAGVVVAGVVVVVVEVQGSPGRSSEVQVQAGGPVEVRKSELAINVL